ATVRKRRTSGTSPLQLTSTNDNSRAANGPRWAVLGCHSGRNERFAKRCMRLFSVDLAPEGGNRLVLRPGSTEALASTTWHILTVVWLNASTAGASPFERMVEIGPDRETARS